MLAALTPEQLNDWATYYGMEPWGFEVEDLRLGILASTVARAAGAKGVEPRHFQLRPPAEDAQEAAAGSPEAQRAAADALFGLG